jgi:hypothetical protein
MQHARNVWAATNNDYDSKFSHTADWSAKTCKYGNDSLPNQPNLSEQPREVWIFQQDDTVPQPNDTNNHSTISWLINLSLHGTRISNTYKVPTPKIAKTATLRLGFMLSC